jgi:hypothetical protein
LLIVVITTAYLVGAPIAQNHVVAPQGVDAVSKLGAYDLLAAISTAAISASISSAVLLTVFPLSFGRESSNPQPPLYIIGDCSR